MRVLGIDPGTINLGYGIVDSGEKMRMVDCGVLRLSPRIAIEERLHSLYAELSEVIVTYQPDEVAIEEPFIGQNAHTAFAIGRAQSIAILAAANRGLPVYYYSPAQIKQQVTSYGRGDKQQVQEMVKIQLGLPQLPEADDAADALAVAICHIQQNCFNQWLSHRS